MRIWWLVYGWYNGQLIINAIDLSMQQIILFLLCLFDLQKCFFYLSQVEYITFKNSFHTSLSCASILRSSRSFVDLNCLTGITVGLFFLSLLAISLYMDVASVVLALFPPPPPPPPPPPRPPYKYQNQVNNQIKN